MFRNALMAVIVTFMSAAAVAQTPQMPKKTGKKIDNAAYTMWASYKPGTFVTMKNVTDFGGSKSETSMTTTLKSVSKDKVVVSIKTTMMAGDQEIEQPAIDYTYEAKIDEYEAPEVEVEAKPKVETDEDTVTIGKKKLACTRTKTTTKTQGQKTVMTVWTCDEVPGKMVKTVTKMSLGTTTATVTAFEVKK